MKYFRVKKEYDNEPTYYKKPGKTYMEVGQPLFGGALFTPAERAKFYPNVKDIVFEIVDIPKNRTYISFGLRFATKVNPTAEPKAKLIKTTCLGYPYYKKGHWGVITNVPLWGSHQKEIYISTYDDKFENVSLEDYDDIYLLMNRRKSWMDLSEEISCQDAVKILTNPKNKGLYKFNHRNGAFWAQLPRDLRISKYRDIY